MPGIRVQHPTQRSVRYNVVDGAVPYNPAYQCTPPDLGGCGSTHLFKTHHLNLDETGAVIVSEGVFERIKGRLALDGFVVTNQVDRPPAIGIGLRPGAAGVWGNIPIVGSPSNREGT